MICTGVNDIIDTNSQAPAFEVAGVQVINDQIAFDMSSDSEGINACTGEVNIYL